MTDQQTPPTPTSTPITGAEYGGSPDTPVQAISQFYAAFEGHDDALMADNWDHEAPVTNMNQLGGIQQGRQAVLERYSQIFNAPFHVHAEFVDYTLVEQGDFFVATGYERGTFERDGETFDFRTRDTRVFRRAGGRWYQTHHHGSFEDPALMARFRKAAAG